MTVEPVEGEERVRLNLIKKKSLNDQSAIASPEVKKHLQEFVLQKQRKDASLVNLKIEGPVPHSILRKTASESNLLKMKSFKRDAARTGVSPYSRLNNHQTPSIPEGSPLRGSSVDSPPMVLTPHGTPPQQPTPISAVLLNRESLIRENINSKSLPNIPSAIGSRLKAQGRKSPPTNSNFRPMGVRRTKSSAILPLRKHLIEKSLAEKTKQDEYYLQHYMFPKLIQPIKEEESSSAFVSVRNSGSLTGLSPLAIPSTTSSLTGLGYDISMLKHKCVCSGNHIESPDRIQSVWKRLVETGLTRVCVRVSRLATIEEIQTCHSEEHVLSYGSENHDENISNGAVFPKFSLLDCGGVGVDSDTYWNVKGTPDALKMAVGTLIELCHKVADEKLSNGFAIVRPPGHHAEYEEAMGFCYFNSVAIAAKSLLAKKPLDRILILDWAIHHGNGTQKAFYNNPNVLYISVHRHDNGNFYPGTGSTFEVGQGAGQGFNVNIAWAGGINPPMGDAEYLACFRNIIMPIANSFDPDFVIISAGFDAAIGHEHPIGGYKVSSACFAYMTHELLNLAKGKIVLALEGGYDLDILMDASEQCVRALLGSPLKKITTEELGRRPCRAAVETIQETLRVQSSYWKCLRTLPDTAFLSHLEAWEKEREQVDTVSAMASLSVKHIPASESLTAN